MGEDTQVRPIMAIKANEGTRRELRGLCIE